MATKTTKTKMKTSDAPAGVEDLKGPQAEAMAEIKRLQGVIFGLSSAAPASIEAFKVMRYLWVRHTGSGTTFEVVELQGHHPTMASAEAWAARTELGPYHDLVAFMTRI